MYARISQKTEKLTQMVGILYMMLQGQINSNSNHPGGMTSGTSPRLVVTFASLCSIAYNHTVPCHLYT